MNKKVFFVIFITFISISGCSMSYESFYKLDDRYLARRQIETRFFEIKNEDIMIVSAIQVLQDLGYIIQRNNSNLGIITAGKDRIAERSASQTVATVFTVLLGGRPVYDVSQTIYITLVSTKSNIKNGYNVRVEFANIVYNNIGGYRVERRLEPEIYEEFFEKLNQSIYLTENNL